MKNRILITGALGQLGEFFVKSLISNNNYVLATDIKENKILDCDFEYFDIIDVTGLRKKSIIQPKKKDVKAKVLKIL